MKTIQNCQPSNKIFTSHEIHYFFDGRLAMTSNWDSLSVVDITNVYVSSKCSLALINMSQREL